MIFALTSLVAVCDLKRSSAVRVKIAVAYNCAAEAAFLNLMNTFEVFVNDPGVDVFLSDPKVRVR